MKVLGTHDSLVKVPKDVYHKAQDSQLARFFAVVAIRVYE